MLEKSDRNRFNTIWRRKLAGVAHLNYASGTNLRVDKALTVLKGGSRLLDIGCGDGVLLSQLQSRFVEVHGLDISEEAVNFARQAGFHADVINLDSQPLPFVDGYFDVVTILSTLQYFYDLDWALSECYRVLEPSGILILSVPNMRAFWRISRLLFTGTFPRVSLDQDGYDGGTLHYFAFANLQGLLEQNRFCTEWAHGIYCLPRFVERFPDQGFLGAVKREFFSAEIFIMATKFSRD